MSDDDRFYFRYPVWVVVDEATLDIDSEAGTVKITEDTHFCAFILDDGKGCLAAFTDQDLVEDYIEKNGLPPTFKPTPIATPAQFRAIVRICRLQGMFAVAFDQQTGRQCVAHEMSRLLEQLEDRDG